MLVYTSNQDYNGSDTLVYQLMDSGTTLGQSDPQMDTAMVILEVHPVNDPPAIVEIRDKAMEEDQTLDIGLEADDIDGDHLEVSAYLGTDAPVQLFVHSDGDSLLIVPGQDWFGSTVVTVVVSDGEYTAEGSFNLQVCLLYTSPSPRDATLSRMPSSA